MNQDQAEVPADYEGEPGSDFFKQNEIKLLFLKISDITQRFNMLNK